MVVVDKASIPRYILYTSRTSLEWLRMPLSLRESVEVIELGIVILPGSSMLTKITENGPEKDRHSPWVMYVDQD